MKKIIIAIIVTCILGCNEEKLPPETQQGEDTFGMYVNGEVWRPYNPSPIGPGDNKPYSTYYPDCNTIEIYAYGKGFIYFTAKIEGVGIYLINTSSPQIVNCLPDSLGEYITDLSQYKTRFMYSGTNCLVDSLQSELEITTIDTLKQIVSGKFEMTLYNEDNIELQITNGIFDINYKTHTSLPLELRRY